MLPFATVLCDALRYIEECKKPVSQIDFCVKCYSNDADFPLFDSTTEAGSFVVKASSIDHHSLDLTSKVQHLYSVYSRISLFPLFSRFW